MTHRDETKLAEIVQNVANEFAARPATAAQTIGVVVYDALRNAAFAKLEERQRTFAIIRAGIGVDFTNPERVEEIQSNPIAFLNQVIATIHVAFETQLSANDGARALSARAANQPTGALS